MSTENNFLGRFVIIDIGHPMTYSSIPVIKQSLQNVLSLACSIRDASRIPVFGCAVLEPSFHKIQQWTIPTGKFPEIDRNLTTHLENPSNVGSKVTMRNYRSILESSIENIIDEFEFYGNEWKSKTQTKEKFNPLCYWPSQMEITLITKKGGCIILEILKNFKDYSAKLHKIEIIEIFNCEDTNSGLVKNYMNFISCNVIKETLHDLDGIFKRWIMGEDSHSQQLQIILNKESGFYVNCELNDCLINPAITTLPDVFSVSSFPLITQKPLNPTVSKPSIHEMEVLKKLRINDLSPSIFFGLPVWIRSAKTFSTNSDEIRYNHEIFKALCHELRTAEIGLVTRLKPSSSYNKITPLYFIVSDGMRLLMKNIVPAELQLPQRLEQAVTSSDDADIKQDAIDVVRSLIQQMETEDLPLKPESIGVYPHLIQHLKSELKKPNRKTEYNSTPKPKEKLRPTQCHDIPPGEYIPKFLTQTESPEVAGSSTKTPKKSTTPSTKTPKKAATPSRKTPKKSTSPSKRITDDEPVLHPALMSPEKKAKYRKHNLDYYEPPEVAEPGVLEHSN